MMAAAALAILIAPQGGRVKTGLEVLVGDGFRPLRGARVGLVTNHSAIDSSGNSIIDVMAAGRGFSLVALFCPEHGLRGTADAPVADGKDERTGLPVHSLYGRTRKPTPAMLEGLDVLVFDIQDVGARFYTYITTMALVMEAAKENGRRVVVLDRPNPIGGVAVEGPVLEEGLRGRFTGYFPIPTRHGMTVGELALLFNREFGIGCPLEVIRMEGWKRSMYFDETGLRWVNPSPNMRSLEAAISYPGLGALEATPISVGRGTPKPFIWYGAPWIDEKRLCAELGARNLPGVRFKPVVFTPEAVPGAPRYPHTGRTCRGFEVEITDRAAYRPVTAVLHVIEVLMKLHPREFAFSKACAMIGARSIEDDLRAGKGPAEIERSWRQGLEPFLARRKAFLLYE